MDLDSMDSISLIKGAVGFAVGSGVGKIVKDVIVNNTKTPDSTINKICIYSGAAVLGMMAKDASKVYTHKKVDEYADTTKKVAGQVSAFGKARGWFGKNENTEETKTEDK